MRATVILRRPGCEMVPAQLETAGALGSGAPMLSERGIVLAALNSRDCLACAVATLSGETSPATGDDFTRTDLEAAALGGAQRNGTSGLVSTLLADFDEQPAHAHDDAQAVQCTHVTVVQQRPNTLFGNAPWTPASLHVASTSSSLPRARTISAGLLHGVFVCLSARSFIDSCLLGLPSIVARLTLFVDGALRRDFVCLEKRLRAAAILSGLGGRRCLCKGAGERCRVLLRLRSEDQARPALRPERA